MTIDLNHTVEQNEFSIIDHIDVETLELRLQSKDPTVRMEAKLDYIITVSSNMAEGMASLMDGLQDSPVGRMLGNMLGVNG